MSFADARSHLVDALLKCNLVMRLIAKYAALLDFVMLRAVLFKLHLRFRPGADHLPGAVLVHVGALYFDALLALRHMLVRLAHLALRSAVPARHFGFANELHQKAIRLLQSANALAVAAALRGLAPRRHAATAK